MEAFLKIVAFMASTDYCNATVFGYEGDPHNEGAAACTHRDIGPDERGIAHRTLPCGTKVVLYNPRTGRKTDARVIDRGPYGATWKGRWRVKKHQSGKGVWRGCVDMTTRVRRDIRHNGFEPIVLFVKHDLEPVVTLYYQARKWLDDSIPAPVAQLVRAGAF